MVTGPPQTANQVPGKIATVPAGVKAKAKPEDRAGVPPERASLVKMDSEAMLTRLRDYLERSKNARTATQAASRGPGASGIRR
jgi:hypothetical protein